VPLYIAFCKTCTENNHAFLKAIETLQYTYRDRLCVVTLDCMASCDAETAIMLEDDYYPAITPHSLCQQVQDYMEDDATSASVSA
jgi:NADH:ubiquinone oxidoreductase subunit E